MTEKLKFVFLSLLQMDMNNITIDALKKRAAEGEKK